MDFIIRGAEIKDVESIYSLLKGIALLHRNGRSDLFSDFDSKYSVPQLEKRLSVPENGVFVADVKGEAAGYVFCEIHTHSDEEERQKRPTLYVDDLCVGEGYRRMGMAKALMTRAEEYGKANDCYDMELNVWEFNTEALNFYSSFGMKTRTRHLEKLL